MLQTNQSIFTQKPIRRITAALFILLLMQLALSESTPALAAPNTATDVQTASFSLLDEAAGQTTITKTDPATGLTMTISNFGGNRTVAIGVSSSVFPVPEFHFSAGASFAPTTWTFRFSHEVKLVSYSIGSDDPNDKFDLVQGSVSSLNNPAGSNGTDLPFTNTTDRFLANTDIQFTATGAPDNSDNFGFSSLTFAVIPNITIQSSTNPSTTHQTVDESAGGMTYTVSISPVSDEQVTVDYATADGSATGGQDYTHVTGTLTFAPGESTKDIYIPILEDTLDEIDETFTVNLSNATNGTIVDSQGTGTITDNDTLPTLSIGNATANESSGTLNFIVTLSTASGQAVSVNYATADNAIATVINATAGTDYTAQSGTLTIPAGATQGTISVPLLDNSLAEADELFFVNLSNPSNATLADAQAQGTILNDDLPTEAIATPVNTPTPTQTPIPASTATPTPTPTPTTMPGSITIHKVATGIGNNIIFRFTSPRLLAPSLLFLFTGSSYTFNNVAPGSYPIRESAIRGWVITDITCTDPDGGTTVDVASGLATIDMDEGEAIACTFTSVRSAAAAAFISTEESYQIPTSPDGRLLNNQLFLPTVLK